MDLQPWQAAALHKTLSGHLGYLNRLAARMERVGFLPDDPIFQRAKRARDAMHDLTVHLHYLSCERERSGAFHQHFS